MVLTAKRAAEICREWYVAFRNMRKGEEKCVLELLDAADTIEALEAAQPKWISVDERLPKELEDVLTYVRNNEVSWLCVSYMYGGMWWSEEKKIRWEVTHWMPLHTKPKEGA